MIEILRAYRNPPYYVGVPHTFYASVDNIEAFVISIPTTTKCIVDRCFTVKRG